MSITIDRHGYITGGVAHCRVRSMEARVSGTIRALRYCVEHEYIKTGKKGWLQAKTIPSLDFDSVYLLSGGGEGEIGWHRFMQELLPWLLETKKKKRWKELVDLCEELGQAAFSLTRTVVSGKMIFKKPKGSDLRLYKIKHKAKSQ